MTATDRKSRPAPEAPTEDSLRAAALAYLARFAATEAALLRVLDRRIARWAAATPEADKAVLAQARAAARAIAAEFVAAGAVDDAAFADSRARRLTRAGRSHRAVSAHLAARGVAAPEIDPERELAAAAMFARRRRIGPFRATSAEADHARELGMMARAGFGRSVAERALRLDIAEADALIQRLRQDGFA